MRMIHVCHSTNTNFNIPDVFTCGACSKEFNTLCLLHMHLSGHDAGGSYHYDNALKVAFPKYDSTCTSTQTNDDHQKYTVETRFTRKLRLFEDGIVYDVNDATLSGPTLGVLDKAADVNLLGQGAKKLRKTLKKEHGENTESTVDFPNATNYSIYKTGKQKIKKCSVNVSKLTEGDRNTFVGGLKRVRKDTDAIFDTNFDGMISPKSSMAAADSDDGEEIDNTDSNKNDCEQESDDLFRIPYIAPFKGRKKKAQPSSKDKMVKERLLKKIHRTNKQKKEGPRATGTHIQNLEIDTSNSGEHDCENSDNLNDTDKETDKLEGNDYFYGKIISTSFIIERQKSDEVVSKGEKKDGSNKVVVDGNWYPDAEYYNGPLIGDCKHVGYSDHLEHLKKKESSGMDHDIDCEKEGHKRLKKELRKEQRLELKCDQCGKTFKHARHFEGHMNFHAGLTPHMCQFCGKAYSNRTSLQMHEKIIHSDKSTWFRCSICESSFATPGRLRNHELSHSTEYLHTCETCNKSYKNQNLLKRHQAYAHSYKQYRCKNCRQSFVTIKERDIHHCKKHVSKDITCGTCGQEFTSERSKVRHEKIHKGIKPHQCHLCLRKFLQKTPFWVHMEKHHDLTKTDLIRLFPEKHLGRNQQHLIKEMDLGDDIERDNDDDDDDFVVDDDDISDKCFVDDDLIFDSPPDLVKL